MKDNNFSELEKNSKLKKKYLPHYFWLKTAAIYPPSCFLFLGLFGLLYLLNHDMLFTYYTIPFVVIFFLGTVWFKATKKQVLKTLLEKDDSYLVSLAKVINTENNWVYIIFTTGTKRHNKHFIQSSDKILKDDNFADSPQFAEMKQKVKTKAEVITIEGQNSSDEIYLMALSKKTVVKKNAKWQESEILPIFYIDERNILTIKAKDINSL